MLIAIWGYIGMLIATLGMLSASGGMLIASLLDMLFASLGMLSASLGFTCSLCISVTTIVIIFNYTDTMEISPFPHIGNKNPLSCLGIKLPDVMLVF